MREEAKREKRGDGHRRPFSYGPDTYYIKERRTEETAGK